MKISPIRKMVSRQFLAVGMIAAALQAYPGVSTEYVYLSGHDADDAVEWDFTCSAGRNAGKPSKISVPSCWEQQGFGEYTYGRFYKTKGLRPSDETSVYSRTFDVPADWRGKHIELVFEGVMTDADVEVNGRSAGAVHQGAFTAFSYDISRLVTYGAPNELKVTVSKQSANKSVNNAERRADWWLFGGIYRPVYLRVLPETHIKLAALNPRADGSLGIDLTTTSLPEGATLTASLDGNDARSAKLLNATRQHVDMKFDNVRPWDPEHPNLYTLTLTLKDAAGKELHRHIGKIGFRTIEFRPRDGFYLNGTKLLVKGVNRHCFYPETGRTTSRRLDLEDVKLIKGMNANAIRSHYSPDRHLLELCDSLGVLYFDEVAGWQEAYDSEVGPGILREMLVHDRNHPCIFAWGNGNEGGFNKNFPAIFEEMDPQKRLVVHPWALKGGIDAHHYPAYQTGVGRLANGYQVFMPTEFLHAQFDKGGGTGLEDFWSNWTKSPLFAGGFIWAFVDEGVMRSDRDGAIDTDGANAPDGIVGPHREKEASWFTIRDVWSPIQIEPFSPRLDRGNSITVVNKSLFSPLSEYKMNYEVLSAGLDKGAETLASGTLSLPHAQPGEAVKVEVGGFAEGDILKLVAIDSANDTVNIWSYPLKYADEYHAGSLTAAKTRKAARAKGATLSANGVSATFDTAGGNLLKVVADGREIPFNNGPVPAGMKMQFLSMKARQQGDTACMVMHYKGAVDSIVWRMTPAGSLGMDIVYLNSKKGNGYDGDFIDKDARAFGFSFSYPEEMCEGMTWLGRGPYRVWRNRQRGQTFGLWHKDYNNAVTGQPSDLKEGRLQYPEFKGYHANVYDARLESDMAPVRIRIETDGIYLRTFTPEEPATRPYHTMTPFPEGDISLMVDIPAMRSYKSLEEVGPQAIRPNVRINGGDEGLRLKVWFDFR